MTSTSAYVLPEKVNIDQLHFQAAKNSRGQHCIDISRTPLTPGGLKLKLKGLRAPFGLGVYNGTKYSLCLTVVRGTPEHTMLKTLEQRVLSQIGSRFAYMLNKPNVNQDTLLALFTPVLKESEMYEPTLRLNLPRNQDDGHYRFSMYGPDRRLVSPETTLEKAADCRGDLFNACIELTGVWFTAGRCGLSWRVDQLMVAAKAPPRTLSTFQFIDDEVDEAEV